MVPTAAPPTLPLACADRVPCARTALLQLPECRRVARDIAQCFGTDCDTQMENFFKAVGVHGNCTDVATRTAYSGACIEGRAGVADLCFLASAPAAAVSTVVVSMVVCFLLTFAV